MLPLMDSTMTLFYEGMGNRSNAVHEADPQMTTKYILKAENKHVLKQMRHGTYLRGLLGRLIKIVHLNVF